MDVFWLGFLAGLHMLTICQGWIHATYMRLRVPHKSTEAIEGQTIFRSCYNLKMTSNPSLFTSTARVPLGRSIMWHLSSHTSDRRKHELVLADCPNSWIQCASYSQKLSLFTTLRLDLEEILKAPRKDPKLAVASWS
jgi:hypothetical protein